MYHLATAFPAIKKVRIPLSRDQVILLIAAINEIFLGLDIYFAHLSSGTIVPREWIPIIFGPIAGVMLLIAGLIAIRYRGMATVLANLVFISSIVVGVLGTYFHIIRAILPNAPVGQRVSLDLLVWAPPMIAPLTFAGIAVMGISAAWIESPTDSGILKIGKRLLHLPYSKTCAYLFMLSLGILVTLISSVFDHARANFDNPWFWLPTLVGVFATVITVGLASYETPPSRIDVTTFFITMLVMMVVGIVGVWFHVSNNLSTEGVIVGERFLRGAPFMAPLLFANMGMIGIAILLDPAEK